MSEDYYKTKESVAEYIHMAEGFNGQEIIDQLKIVLTEGSVLLEIGSGPGSDWEIISKSYDVIGSDNSEEFLNHLTTKFPEGEFLKLDAATLATEKKFDGIYSNKVLHHLTDEQLVDSIERQCELLNPSGIVCHSFWEGKDSEFFKGLFVNYHTEIELASLFQKHFEIITLETYEEFEAGDSLLLIGRKL